ncbi:MAG: hypothetical protein R3F59_29550 [Myxococcota bacterium]
MQEAHARAASANRPTTTSFSVADYAVIVQHAFSGARVGEGLPVLNAEMFATLWRSHRARAVHDGDFALAAAASALIDAADRLPEGALAAGAATLNGEEWAVWVDLSRRVILAAARPAAVYLAG